MLGGCRTISSGDQAKREEAIEEAQNRTTKLPIGTIHVVDPNGEFVIVRTNRFADIDPDSDLLVMDGGGREVAKLQASPARKGAFLTADILYGAPQVGNHVLVVHRSRPMEPSSGASDADEIQILE